MTEDPNLTGRHLINGEWIESVATRVPAVNPATGEEMPPGFHQAQPAEADRAMATAAAAFNQTRELPSSAWADLLDSIAARIEGLGDALLEVAHAETALPMARLASERARTALQLRMYGAEVRDGFWVDAVIDTADPDRKPLPKPDLRRMLQPLGPVVVFDASNFPFAYGACGGDTASALATGNPVVVKAHPAHPGTDELCARAVVAALEDQGRPKGLFGLLHGGGPEIGAALVSHPLTEAVGFTGSLRAGRALMDIAAARPRPIRVFAEMGSVNPVVILPGAIAERGHAVAEGLAASVTGGVGQFCTKPGIVLALDGRAADGFVSDLSTAIRAAGGGTMLNAGIRKGFVSSVAHLAAAPGVRVLVQGGVSGHTGVSPSLLETDGPTFRANPALREEAFGPAALVVRCADIEGLLAAVETLEGQLTGSVQADAGDDPALVRRVVAALQARVGRLIFNGYPTGVEVCPAMVHGGPYPATSAPDTTSVGTLSIRRWAHPVAYQNVPDELLPPALQAANPLGIRRVVNGQCDS